MKKILENLGIIIVILVIILAGILFVLLYFKDVNEKEMDFSSLESEISDISYEYVDNDKSEVANTDIDYLSGTKAQNPDTVAWLMLPDAGISYPIVQSNDNEYYLSHKFNKKKSQIGNPFLDYRCEKDFSGFNSVIYGHNIKGHKVFANINKYKDKSFFDNASDGVLITSSEVYDFNILACVLLPNDGFVFDTVFIMDSDKYQFMDSLKVKAVNYRETDNLDIANLRLVTLSTCSYEFDDARTVLVGYLTEKR